MRYVLWISVCIGLLALPSSAQESRPDSNFKSIHQQEWEAHQSDSAVNNTLHQPVEKTDQPERDIINVSLLVLVIVLLVVMIAVSFLIRRVKRTRER